MFFVHTRGTQFISVIINILLNFFPSGKIKYSISMHRWWRRGDDHFYTVVKYLQNMCSWTRTNTIYSTLLIFKAITTSVRYIPSFIKITNTITRTQIR